MAESGDTGEPPLNDQDLADIQGLIVRGYNMAAVRHFVLTIGDVAAALDFIDATTTGRGPLTITSAARWPGNAKPDYALNVGFTASGIQALCLPESVSFGDPSFGNFASFLQGAVAQAETVGDVGVNSPDGWVDKLSTAHAADAHMLLSLYTHDAASRDHHSEMLRSMVAPLVPAEGPSAQIYELDVDVMNVDLPDGRVHHKIHFGYTDGISNPSIKVEGQPPLRPGQLPYVDPWRFVMRDYEKSQYNPPKPAEFGLNGSFSAFRILEQDVAAFDAFLAAEDRTADDQEYLAAKLCGRWRNGNPVVERPDTPGDVVSESELRDFDYGTDSVGQPCPYSAHTRRSNPRGGPHVAGVTDQTSFRILRRANPYGQPWTGTDDGVERGLAGHFICSSLANQFEFIMKSWVNEGTFAPKPAGVDPLLAHIDGDTEFTYYEKDKPVSVPGLSQFVTTRGGMYCFLPSMTSLRWIAANGNTSQPWKVPVS